MTKTRKPNPFIDIPNYYEGYQTSVEELKNRPELIEFGKLCYEVLHVNESGKRLMELLEERYILPGIVRPDNPKYEIACVWAEGFKEAFRLLKRNIETHGNYIKSETNKA